MTNEPATPAWTMTPAWLYDLALCLHILGAFVLVAGTVVAGVGFEVARQRRTCAEIVVALGISRIGALLVVSGALTAAGCGLWLVGLGRWGYAAPWVDVAIGMLTLAAVVGALAGQPAKRARRRASQLLAEDLPPDHRVFALLNDRLALILNYFTAVILLGIVVDMVVKPGA